MSKQGLEQTELAYWLALLRAPGIGAASYLKLVEQFPKLSDLFLLPKRDILSFGISEATYDYLKNPEWFAIEKELAWREEPLNYILTWRDSAYPPLLREIASAPPVLYVKGNLSVLNTPQLAIVGSRHPTAAGNELAFQFADYLASGGMTITSGLALGIDGASHRGALASKGCTIAVIGTGIDKLYPVRHKALAEEILERGAIVSEFPLNTPPVPENFPRRNRIISGLSLGVLVVEAALQSGSLITARYALEQGREVFAIPGSIHNPNVKGCHALLKQGAKLVETAADILEELGPLSQLVKPTTASEKNTLNQRESLNLDLKSLDTHYKQLINCVGYEATPVDLLIVRSGFTAETVSSMVLMLELQGLIYAVPGGYIRNTKVTAV